MEPDGFVVPKGNSQDMHIRFRMSSVPTKPIAIYLYGPSNYYFKLKLIALSGALTRSLAEPESLYFIIGLIILSTSYIGLILRIVIREKDEVNKKSGMFAKTPNVVVKKPTVKLNLGYLNELKSK